LFAAATLAAPPSGGNAGAGGWRGGGWSGNHGGHGHWRGSVGIYYGPYWGWGWPGYYGYGYWPGYYGYYGPGYYYNYGYAYAPYGYAPYSYVPPGANGGVTYIEHEPEAASNKPAPVHVPDGAASAPPRGTQWWYLCNSPQGAYPYVRECPDGWERVPAVPPSGTIK
jgi:hypothetical protein